MIEYWLNRSIDILVYDIIYPHTRLIFMSLIIYSIYKLLNFIVEVARKKLLLDAFAQQLIDDISRMDIGSYIFQSDKMQEVISTFVLDNAEKIYKDRPSLALVGDYSQSDEIKALAEIGGEVLDYRDRVLKGFLTERKSLRWMLDGLEALIGDNKSIEAAWEKGLRCLDRYITVEGQPWIPSYMKLLNLPHNPNDPKFVEKARQAASRHHPKGYLSLLVACRMFDYHKRLRYFELRGEEAWDRMMKFKARRPSDFDK